MNVFTCNMTRDHTTGGILMIGLEKDLFERKKRYVSYTGLER